MVMRYRQDFNLPVIPISESLTIVAQTHVKDLMNNNPNKGNCNLHSWSDKGDWTSCCYTPDHISASCVWNKPRELTSYSAAGYEIAFWSSSGATAKNALNGWKKSKGHNALIINKDNWYDNNWKAIGIGIFGNYAVIWFGEMPEN